MGLYLTRAKYTNEAFKGMLSNPHDRGAAATVLFESAGMKLSSIHFSPSMGEVVCMVEGDAMKAAAIDIVVMGSGMFSSVKAMELIDMESLHGAMKHAGELARKYATTHKAPG